MIKHTLTFMLLITLLLALPVIAAERGVKRVEIKTQAGELVGLYEQRATRS